MPDQRKKFSQIYDRYIDKIYRFVFFKVNSKDIAEDLTSETFLKIWKVFQNDDQEIENMQAFLYRTARNLVIDYYRIKGKNQTMSVEHAYLLDPRQDLEENAKLNSDIENIKQVLVNLKEDYQNVIIWYYLDDLPIPKIAKLLDRTEDATRVLLHRALESVRLKIDQVGKV